MLTLMSPPRVSIVIPVFNRSAAVRKTLDSVLSQEFVDWELLIVDDGSTDDTPEICAGYLDPRVRLIRQANQGQAAGRNLGLSLARGEYVAFLDHDDLWHPEKLRLQVGALDKDPASGVVYGRVRHVDEDGGDHGIVRGHEAEGQIYVDLLVHHNFLYTMSLPMMRTALVRDVGGFDPSTDISDDLDLFLRLAVRTRFRLLPHVLIDYNIGNPIQQTRDIFRVYRSEYACITRHLRTGPPLGADVRRQVARSWGRIFAPGFRERGWDALRRGDCSTAWRCYRMAIRLRPGLLADTRVLRDLLALVKRSLMNRPPVAQGTV